MQKIWQKGIIGIIMLDVFLLPISAGIQKLINWIFIKINLDFIFKSNILSIISHQRHRNVCAGFVLYNYYAR